MAKKNMEELRLELCNYCDWNIEGRVNTNQFNLCEGRNCDKAYENYLEEEE